MTEMSIEVCRGDLSVTCRYYTDGPDDELVVRIGHGDRKILLSREEAKKLVTQLEIALNMYQRTGLICD